MPASTAFPAFITDAYQPGNGFADFERAAMASSERVKRQFQSDSQEISRVFSGALRDGVSGGKLDLNVGQFRQAAAEANLYAEALRATLRTASALAAETQDTSAATRNYLQALSAQAIEAERAKAAADGQVATYTRLQAALDATSAKNSRLAESYRQVYVEQARAAQAEVAARRAQEIYTAGYAPGLARPTSIASLSGGVFQAAFAQSDAAARGAGSALSQISGAAAQIERLRQVEAAAANGATMLAAIHRDVGLAIEGAGKSASASAAVFQQAAAEEERLALEAEQAWAQLERLAAGARQADVALIDAGKAAQSAFSRGLVGADQFERQIASITAAASGALASPRNKAGSLDLNVAQYQQASTAAQAQAVALREIASAAEAAAKATGDTSEATRIYIQAARAAAVQGEQNAEAATMQATAMERLQVQLSQTASAATAVVGTSNRYGASLSGLHQNTMTAMFAQMELMHVVAMGTDAYAAGIPITRVAAMEAGRIGEALIFMSQASGNATGMFGAFARFIGSGWGSAIILGGSLLASLIVGLSKAGDQAEKSAEQFKKVVEQADAFGQAQSDLGKVIDLTTGKMKAQNEVLVEAVRLQAQLALMAANQKIGDLTPKSIALIPQSDTLPTAGSPGLDPAAAGAVAALRAQQDARVKSITDAFINVVGNDALATNNPHQYSVAVGKAIDVAIAQMDKLARSGKGASANLDDAKKKLIEIGVAAEQKAAALESISLLAGGPAPDLKKPGKDHSDEINRLKEQQEALARSIEAATAPFIDQAGAARQAEAAFRSLDGIQQKLNDDNTKFKKLTGANLPDLGALNAQIVQARQAITAGEVNLLQKPFEEAPKHFEKATQALQALADIASKHPGDDSLLGMIAHAQDTIENGLAKPMRDFLKQLDQQHQVQDLINRGQQDQADLLKERFALMRAIGAENDADLAKYLAAIRYQGSITDFLKQQLALTHQQALAEQALQAKRQVDLQFLDSYRQTLEQTIALLTNGNLFGAGSNLAKGLVDGFKTLVSQSLTEQLFGGVFRSLQDQINGRNPVMAAGERMASALDGTQPHIVDLGSAAADTATALARIPDVVNSLTSGAGSLGGGPSAASGVTGADVLAAAKSYAGLTQRGGKGALEQLFSQANIHVDPTMTAWCAAFVNAVLATKGLAGTGSLAASSFLHFGSATSNPSPGDIAVLAHHVGFFAGFNAAGNPLITGGNQAGGRVNTESFPGSSILSYRHIGDLGIAAAAANDNIASLAATVAGLHDPVTSATQGLSGLLNTVAGWGGGDGFNGETATVTGHPRNDPASPVNLLTKSLQELMTSLAKGIGIKDASAEKIGQLSGKYLSEAIQGAAYGSAASNLVLGSKGSNTGAQIGGAIGNIAGTAAAASIGLPPQVGGAIGSFIGGIEGGLIGSLFKHAKQAGSSFAVDQFGNISVKGGSGDKASSANAVSEANSVAGSIQNIAKQLGGSILPSALTGVTLGYRASDKNQPFRVDTTGAGRASGNGVLAFATEQEAVDKAIQLMIQRGVINGISAASQKILQSGQDLQAAIEKATLIESVPKQLKQLTDPVGAALDALNAQFSTLVSALKEGGATAAQFADAQKLYDLQRASAIKQASDTMTSSLKGLIDELTTNNDAFSLTDRLASARATYDPLAKQIASGDLTNADQFEAAAKAVADILRQLDGSQAGYFDFINQATGLAKTALAGQQSLIDAANAAGNPFASTGTGTDKTSTDPVVGGLSNIGGILSGGISDKLDAVNDNLSGVINAINNLDPTISSYGGGGTAARLNF